MHKDLQPLEIQKHGTIIPNDGINGTDHGRALIVLSTISSFDNHPALLGEVRTITCPGRRRLDHGREGTAGKYEDSDPVKLNIGAVRIGAISLGWTDAELYNICHGRG